MAALGFSVLMREWRRGMAFDPWHGSLYLNLSAAITLSSTLFCSYRWRERGCATFKLGPGAECTISESRRGSLLIDHQAWKENKRETGHVKILFYLQSFTMSMSHDHHTPVSYHMFVQTTQESHGSTRTSHNSCSLTACQRR